MLKATEKLPKNPTLSKSEWLTFPVCLVVLLGLFSWLGWPGFSAGFCSLLFYLVWNQVNDCFDAFARTWEGNLVFMDHLAWSRPLIWEAKQQKTHLNRKWHLEKEVLQLDTVSYKRFPGFFLAETVSSPASYCRVFPGKVDICDGFPFIHLPIQRVIKC